MYPKN